MWSYISPRHKTGSRIDRLYVNKNLSKNVINYKHVRTPKENDHRVISFTIKNKIEIGRPLWKMNTSILKDNEYKRQMDNLIVEMEAMNIQDEIKWWHIFTICVRSISVTYSHNKNWIKTQLKRKLVEDMNILEQKQNFQEDTRYKFLKEKFKTLIQEEIEGYKRRIKYQTKFEDNELDIAYYAQTLKNQSVKHTISELAESKTGKKHSNPKKLIEITTKFYTNLYCNKPTNIMIQNKVLKNIKNKLSNNQKEFLCTPCNFL